MISPPITHTYHSVSPEDLEPLEPFVFDIPRSPERDDYFRGCTLVAVKLHPEHIAAFAMAFADGPDEEFFLVMDGPHAGHVYSFLPTDRVFPLETLTDIIEDEEDA